MGYGLKWKIGPPTSYMLCTLIVEHIDVNITEAPSQRQVWKTSAMLRLLQVNLVLVENGKICHVPEVARGGGRVRRCQSVDTAVVTPRGITGLYCRAGWEVWLDTQASQQWSPSSPCWFLFFCSWNLWCLASPAMTTPSPSVTGHVMNLHATRCPG